MVDKDFDLYCRGCYAKQFGPKVKNIYKEG
jgi:hypothetical protein